METKCLSVEDVADEAWSDLFEESFGEVPAKKPGQTLVVWGEPGAVFGWAVVERFGAYLRLAWAAIRPEYRGQGKGKEGLGVLQGLSRELGADMVGFVVRLENRRMQILALKAGFEIAGLVVGNGACEVSFQMPVGGDTCIKS